jgi:Orsellinic acid/F9775 biosynthesis cluster protein D
MKPFIHLPNQRLIVCSECKHAVLPSSVRTHMQDRTKHTTTKQELDQLIDRISLIPDLILAREELNNLIMPQVSNPPIPQLRVPRIDGMKCQLWNKFEQCSYISCHLGAIQTHCKMQHNWNNQQQKGKRRNGKVYDIPWISGIHCQQFFVRGSGAQYFEVAKPEILEIEIQEQDEQKRITREILKRTKQEWKAGVEKSKKQQVKEAEEAREPNLWLRQVGWASHLEGLDIESVRAFINPSPTYSALVEGQGK